MDSSIDTQWGEYVELGKWLSSRIKPELVVDLGTYHGVSALSFAGDAKKVITIDKFENKKDEKIANNVLELADNIEIIKDSFTNQVNKFDDNSIDILHIDGDHKLKSITDDCMLWSPKVKKNGIMLMHDVYNPVFIGPFHVFVNYISAPKLMFIKGSGLGVISRNTDLLKEIYNTWAGEVIMGRVIGDLYKIARVNAEWVEILLESYVPEKDQKDFLGRTSAEFKIDPLHLERWKHLIQY